MTVAAAHPAVARLTVEQAARIMREVRRGTAYRTYPLGAVVYRYLRWLENEYGATRSTIVSYEGTLRLFALDHLDLELADFAPPVGTERIREFIDSRWADRSAGTRATVTSHMKAFFGWCYERDLLPGDPTAKIRRPKKRGVERRAHRIGHVRAILNAQPLRDRTAIGLMAYLGLRKNEVRLLRWADVNLEMGDVRVHGKGGTVVSVPMSDFAELRQDIADLAILDGAQPSHYLLYPVRVGNVRWSASASGVVREYRDRPMQPSTMHRWWTRCLEHAGVPHFPMHELRHTAITEFIRATGDMALAREFARHASAATTVDIYGHLDRDDLRRGMQLAAARWKDTVH